MINVKDISFKYAGQHRLLFDHFSLQLEENRIYGLLGKNGMGKSTLLYLIAGLLRPTVGQVCCDGIETQNRSAEILREMFLVPEEYDLPPMTLARYARLLEGFYPNFSHEVLERCLTDFELGTDLQLQSLSMGQKKKVYMSLALAANTRYLLMDEPTNGLDIPSKSQFRKVVAENMSDDRTLVISTHQVHDVESLLDHIMILTERELLLNAPVAELQERYAFGLRMPQEMDESVIYAEPSLQGNAVMMHRTAGMAETQVNLELLFNAVTKGLVK